jgi:hypothetical protein
MPDRLRRNGPQQETRLVIDVPGAPLWRKWSSLCLLSARERRFGRRDRCECRSTADLRQNTTPHIVAMYQFDTSD